MRTQRKIVFRPVLFISPLCACPMRKISLATSEKREWKSGFAMHEWKSGSSTHFACRPRNLRKEKVEGQLSNLTLLQKTCMSNCVLCSSVDRGILSMRNAGNNKPHLNVSVRQKLFSMSGNQPKNLMLFCDQLTNSLSTGTTE